MIKKSQKVFSIPDEILEELFVLKFASVLEVGPYFDRLYGYDIVLYKNEVRSEKEAFFILEAEFTMEYCLKQRQ